MIVTTDALFKVAYENFAIGAYNINNAEQAMGLILDFGGVVTRTLFETHDITERALGALGS